MRPILNENALTTQALQAMQSFHADTVKEVQDTVAKNAVVIVGMAQNPVVKKARKLFTEKGIPFTYLEYGSYMSDWKKRLAIKLWSGWPTFPQIFVKGKLVGGCSDATKLLEQGELQKLLKN